MSQNKNNSESQSTQILRPQVLTGKDMFLHKTFDDDSMKHIFQEFVESNPDYIKQVLNKISQL